MNHLVKYKKALIVVLMALYAFITTPAQMWHSHSHATTLPATSTNQYPLQELSHFSDDSMETVCGICAHHYSVYTADNLSTIQELLLDYTQPGQEFLCSIPTLPNTVFCNKGPPTGC